VVRSWKGPVLVLILLLATVLAIAGCGRQSSLVTAPVADEGAGGFVLKLSDAGVQAAIRVQNAHTSRLMAIPGVVGTAITADSKGQPAIMIMTETPMGARLPAVLDGYTVIEEVTGKIKALRTTSTVSHTAKQTPPIQLGTSGGSAIDLANGYCCSGTLGSLVQKGGAQYILSNSHVLCGDVVAGGNGKVAAIGDDITQPGLIDANCSSATTNLVADLSSLSTTYPPTSTPNVDCAIAQVRSGMVRTDGAILEIGTISASTVAAYVGQLVKKSGRTTGLTRSKVTAINATVTVGYETECAGTSYSKTYTGQVVCGKKFIDAGDSGSLMVEDVTTNPRAVGLLFAGSSQTAIANPIGAVLSQLGATMVGQ
jgi:hypothetical protein